MNANERKLKAAVVGARYYGHPALRPSGQHPLFKIAPGDFVRRTASGIAAGLKNVRLKANLQDRRWLQVGFQPDSFCRTEVQPTLINE